LLLDEKDLNKNNAFKIPYINSRFVILLLWMIVIGFSLYYNSKGISKFFDFSLPWAVFKHRIPMLVYIISATALTLLCVIQKLSLIPVISLLANFYLMTELGITNWLRFFIWLVVGLMIYFIYGRRRSKLNNKAM
jgi:basic amino acid/polyamine antiporter, APA family